MSSSLSYICTVLVVALISSKVNECHCFTLTPSVKSGPTSPSSSALYIFGRRRSKKQVAEQKTSGKAELKIVPAITKVEPRELDKYFDKVGILPQGVSLPKVASSSSLISEEEVLAAHKAWGEGLCLIAKTYEDKGYDEAKKVAQQVLDAAYGYAKGIPVLFKPTLASGSQTFRTTEEGALSYFVGGNKKYPNDSGFAIKNWRRVESYPAGILLLGNTALSTGNVHCIDKDGKCTVVDKTWGYQKDNEGNVRIILHHSSLPYKK
jgi:hypothetical protein